MIYKGYIVGGELREYCEKKLKRSIHEDIYTLSMSGSRILVGLDKAEEMHKGVLHKPKRAVAQEQQEMGSGWILAVGEKAGIGTAPHPHGIQCRHPADLLGRHVFFQMWAGRVFRSDEDDGEFEGRDSLVVLTDRDIQSYEALNDGLDMDRVRVVAEVDGMDFAETLSDA